jgi:deoxyribodipyrimidine photolyase-related protein
MKKQISLVFPNQLFEDNPILNKNRKIYLIEDSLFFGDVEYPMKFHKQKIALHRSTMNFYSDHLKDKGYEVEYINYQKKKIDDLLEDILLKDLEKIFILDPVDFILKKRLKNFANKNKIELEILDTSLFINDRKDNKEYLEKNSKSKTEQKYRMQDFYKFQRRRLDILMKDGKPEGGEWSYDDQNREKLPESEFDKIPDLPRFKSNKYWDEALEYVEKNFKDNYGEVSESPLYPINFPDSKKWLQDFLQNRFEKFGPYEDAIYDKNHKIYHSILTPILNIGLITPKEIVDETIKFADKNNIPINSYEGFIRQIIGWREFMRLVYVDAGVEIRNSNEWNHKRKIPGTFWKGETEVIPIDETIKEILETGYCHHIERLMVLGNFMFLAKFDPKEIYKWFMEMFVDSYDWVMVPNVYGMSQNSSGGLMTTKPYISGSNYVLKMSNYKRDDWCEIWDAMYWSWIIDNEKELMKNHRMSLIASRVGKMDEEKKRNYLKIRDNFLK